MSNGLCRLCKYNVVMAPRKTCHVCVKLGRSWRINRGEKANAKKG